MTTESFTFFWSGPLSNWHPSPFIIDGVAYNCTEQWMMVEKSRMFGDVYAEKKIMSTANPSDHKRWGRAVVGFNTEEWNNAAKDIVFRGSYAKFTQDDRLKEILLNTKGTTLVEASPHDQIWGIGLRKEDPRARNRATWLGTNWLGEVLTQVRDQIMTTKH